MAHPVEFIRSGANLRLWPLALFGILLFFNCAAFGQEWTVRISPVDTAGRPIPFASAVVAGNRRPSRECERRSNTLFCKVQPSDMISVVAEGFAEAKLLIGQDELDSNELMVRLSPAILSERVVISAGRVETRIGDTPASISLLGRTQIETSAASSMDDILRQLPGFSIFRRSSSRHANPTTQGVSLRGVGSSGASRTLVLADGVPLNDTFGGWVQWNRIVPVAVEQVEVVRGGSSSLFGSGSLSGTVNTVSRRVGSGRALSTEIFGGSQGTFSSSLFAGIGTGAWSFDAAASHSRTTGYILTEPSARGAVDTPAGFRAGSLQGRIERDLSQAMNIFFRPSYFSETRENGTPLQTNRTVARHAVLGGRANGFSGGNGPGAFTFDWRVFGGTQVYEQSFSAVSAGRLTETLTRLQRSPSGHLGFSTQLSAITGRHTFVGGFEGRGIGGSSDEVVYVAGSPASLVGAGGRERSLGVFLQDIFSASDRLLISASIRYDRWKMTRGLTASRNLSTGAFISTPFPGRAESALSPRISLLLRGSEQASFHISASSSFRSPTLNELYRGFRVGNVVTEANENLRAERASNFEGGTSMTFGSLSVRTVFFFTNISDAISNVTVSASPNLITRRRMNAGSTRSAGFEADAEFRFRALTLNAGYQFAYTTVTSFPSNPALVGLRVPQVARDQFTAQATYSVGRWTFAAQTRSSGEQFDDDLNEFRLEPFFQADLFISGRISRRLTAFFGAENLTNSRYSVGRTPLRTISAPAGFRIGLRFH